MQMAAGDLILVFPGHGHHLCEGTAVVTRPVEEFLEAFHCGRVDGAAGEAGGPFTSLICGYFTLEGFEQTLLHASLPAMIQVRGDRQRPLPFVDYLLRLGIEETASPEPCALFDRESACTHPADQGVAAVRVHPEPQRRKLAGSDQRSGNWPSDPLMHDQPEAPWTVATLAKQVAMSRSVFSARFTALMGKPPLEYLFEWRMLKASYLLRTTRTELKEVSAKVGYESAAAFSKAFTRWAGVPPGSYRQSVQSEPCADFPAKIPPVNSAGRGCPT